MLSYYWLKTPISFIKKEVISSIWVRTIAVGNAALCETDENKSESEEVKGKVKLHPLSDCINYMKSKAYRTTYGDKPVWHVYVRNFKGSFPPPTRLKCIIKGIIKTASPCPICRDEYLLLHYQNTALLKQFISPFGGEILDSKKTGICQMQQARLKIAIKKAQNYGLLSFAIPHRHYDYSLYNKK